MPVSAHDVARELRSQLPLSGVVKVHKLLYLCQGWHLAWYGEPLFVEDIEAWDNGPVVADLWRDEKNGKAAPTAEQLDGRQLLVLDYVMTHYGELSGRELIDLTHREGPWAAAIARGWRDKVLTPAELQEFFVDAQRRDDAEIQWVAPPEALEDLDRAFSTPVLGSGRDETDDIRRWLAHFHAADAETDRMIAQGDAGIVSTGRQLRDRYASAR